MRGIAKTTMTPTIAIATMRLFIALLLRCVAQPADPTMAAARQVRIPNPESQIVADSITALAFDAYGTLFDVFSVTSLCEQMFPGHGMALATLWRSKQLQYTLLLSMMNRYKDFRQVTQDGLVYAARALKLELTADKRTRLM